VRLWDAATGEELVRLPGHSNYVLSLAFSPDGKNLVSSSGDTTLRLWDTEPLRRAAAPLALSGAAGCPLHAGRGPAPSGGGRRVVKERACPSRAYVVYPIWDIE
jgi:hypothetical protein